VEAILGSGVYVREGKWTLKVSYPAHLDLENDDIGASQQTDTFLTKMVFITAEHMPKI